MVGGPRRPGRRLPVSRSVFDTVADLIWCRPTEFENRTQALFHLLCVPNNGYTWRNGHLVKAVRVRRPALHEGFDGPAFGCDEVIDLAAGPDQARRVERQAIILRRRITHRTLAATPGPLKDDLVPDLDDVISLVPADAVREWREAAREVQQALDLRHALPQAVG